MKRTKYALISLASLLALALACSRQSSAPTAPSGAAPAASAHDAADCSTLKVTAPPIISPNNVTLDKLPTTLVAGASTGTFGAITGLAYRFQVLAPNGSVVQESTTGGTSVDVTVDLTEST